MTWVVERGVRVWNRKTFVEPPDHELAEYGWTRGYVPSGDRKPDHTCVDCPKKIHRQSTRCWDCSTARRKAGVVGATSPNTCADCPATISAAAKRCRSCHVRFMTAAAVGADAVFDVMVVERILAGDWRLPTTKAEKIAVVERWLDGGGTQNALHQLTGWRVERYVRRPAEDVAA